MKLIILSVDFVVLLKKNICIVLAKFITILSRKLQLTTNIFYSFLLCQKKQIGVRIFYEGQSFLCDLKLDGK